MIDLAKLRAAYAAKINEAKTLAQPFEGNETMPKDAAQKINALLGEADEIKAQIEMGERLGDADRYASEPVRAEHLGFREAGPGEGDAPIDAKAWRSFEIPVATPWGIQRKEFRYHVPLAVQLKGYEPAFEAYLRKGKSELGPSDRKALSEGTDSAGGYLVPEDYQTQILKKIATLATVRTFARVVTTSRDVVTWPRIKYTTNNEYTSGVRLTWVGEVPAASTTARVTDQVFGEINIPINTAMASQLVSMNLIEDAAFDVLGISSDLFAEAFALGENDCFWQGTGAGQPRGIITDVSDTTNFDASGYHGVDTANTILASEIIDVCYGLPAQYERNARWFMTKQTAKYIRNMADTYGNYIWPVSSQVGELGPAPQSILGFPVVYDEFIDEISSASDTPTYPIVFGDLTGYIVADRVGLSVKRDENLYAEYNQVLLLGRKRVGGQLAEAYRLSFLKTANST